MIRIQCIGSREMLDITITVLQMKRCQAIKWLLTNFAFLIQNYASNSNTKINHVANEEESIFIFA